MSTFKLITKRLRPKKFPEISYKHQPLPWIKSTLKIARCCGTLGDSGFLQSFRVVSSDSGKPRYMKLWIFWIQDLAYRLEFDDFWRRQVRPDLNGRFGEVVEWDDREERWKVRCGGEISAEKECSPWWETTMVESHLWWLAVCLLLTVIFRLKRAA